MKIKLRKSEVIDLMYSIETVLFNGFCSDETGDSISEIHEKLQSKLYGNRKINQQWMDVVRSGDSITCTSFEGGKHSGDLKIVEITEDGVFVDSNGCVWQSVIPKSTLWDL